MCDRVPFACAGPIEVTVKAFHEIFSTDEWWNLSPSQAIGIAMEATGGRARPPSVRDMFITAVQDRGLVPLSSKEPE